MYLCDTNFDQFNWSFKYLLTVVCATFEAFLKIKYNRFFFLFLSIQLLFKNNVTFGLGRRKSRDCLILWSISLSGILFSLSFPLFSSPSLSLSLHLCSLLPYSGRGTEVRGNVHLTLSYSHLRFFKSFSLHICAVKHTSPKPSSLLYI